MVFVAVTGGDRRAALSAGPQVRTAAEAWLQYDKDERAATVVAEALGLTAAEVESALSGRRSPAGRGEHPVDWWLDASD